MKTVGIFYGTTGGRTKDVVDVVAEKLGDVQVFDVANGIDDISSFDNIILASSTYGLGDLQDDWSAEIENLSNMDLDGKTIALIGVGDSAIFSSNFAESIKRFEEVVSNSSATIVGFTSIDGYVFDESEAVSGDEFMGLAIDSSFDDDEVAEKVESWVEDLKNQFA